MSPHRDRRAPRWIPKRKGPILRVHIVRHGETDENRQGIMQGQLNTKLNAIGVEQARLVGLALKDVPFCVAFSSDLERAAKTAEHILDHHPLTPVYEDKQLRERDMGELQGKTSKSYDRKNIPKTVEPSNAFAERTIAWWEDTIMVLLPSLSSNDINDDDIFHVLVVSHGAYIATLCAELVDRGIVHAEPRMRMGSCFNTSVTVIDMWMNKRGSLQKYSDVSHLLAPVVKKNADELTENVEDTTRQESGHGSNRIHTTADNTNQS